MRQRGAGTPNMHALARCSQVLYDKEMLDNAKVVHDLRKRAKPIVTEQWLQAADMCMQLHIKRVGTHDNIADLPSREELELLRAAGATEVPPSLHASYLSSDVWEVLQERWGM